MNLDLSTPEKIEQNLNDALAKIEKSNNIATILLANILLIVRLLSLPIWLFI
jgi:hypothetical protein